MFSSFRDLMYDSDHSALLDEVETIDGRYHDDDEFIVSAAAAVGNGAILVTDDGRLRTALAAAGIPAAHGFEVVDIAGAVAMQAALPPAQPGNGA